jgi:hypothetical protein
MNLIKRLFFDEHQHWESFKRKHGRKIRPIVIKEVENLKIVGIQKRGLSLYVKVPMMKKNPYRCIGRVCTTCSVGESEEWGRLLTEDGLQVNHRHVFLQLVRGFSY